MKNQSIILFINSLWSKEIISKTINLKSILIAFLELEMTKEIQNLKNNCNFFFELIHKNSKDYKDYTWKHISELRPGIKIFDERIKSEDANQGYLSNCYLISSISALAEFPNIIRRLFNITKSKSNHIYSVNLCIGGIFQEYLLDGYFPVGKDSRLKFCTSKSNVLWPLLLEKAYAKAFGAYWNIGGAGAPCRALKDLTGAPTEFVKFKDSTADEVYEKILSADKKGYIMVSPTKNDKREVETHLGMIPFHAYTVISAIEIQGEKLIKLRNPHGKGEWKGDWGDSSPKWTSDLRNRYNVEDAVDGTFFMPLENFRRNFIEVAICNYIKENILSAREMIPQEMHGMSSWKVHVNKAGEYYVGMSQPDRRNVEVDKNIYTTMVMFKCAGEGRYEYIGGKLYIERDPFFKAKLASGEYILIVIFFLWKNFLIIFWFRQIFRKS